MFSVTSGLALQSRSSGFDHIQHVLSSIKFLHQFTGHFYPGDSFEFKVLLRGLKRKLSKSPKQALPITPEMLILMYEHVDISKPMELAHWTSFLFALRLLYRKSSIAPESLKIIDHNKGLSREKAKLLAENPAERTCPAFSFYEAGLLKCVTHKSFTAYLKFLLVKIGLNPSQWSGHSFRRGGASLLYRLGIDPLTIQASGDWSSDTFLRYLEVTLDRLWSAQCAMASFSCV